ncbi:beta-1,3-glucosyltransferase [Papilio machaon]|uniref:beta-1,3-glucosyltransferase n=1 Tax=Papilio machaon TaxID=76193 RepID=UPI001E665F82|nr:beta-1,3-glucosyltransferase [Papilio machaon]
MYIRVQGVKGNKGIKLVQCLTLGVVDARCYLLVFPPVFPPITMFLVVLFIFVDFVTCFDSRNVVYTVVSQAEPYHASVAIRLKQDIEHQVLELEGRRPIVHITHEDFPVGGAWTIIPLLRPLTEKHRGTDVRWVVFLEPHTAVRCGKLLEALAAADGQKDTMWIGYPLSDEEPTIIHHFTFYEELQEDGGFVYPNFASGFAMRITLMKKLLKEIESGDKRLEADFSIDAAFELAQLVYGDVSRPGPLLTPDLRFCVVSADNCATYPRPFDLCGSAIPEETILFAVKTWSGFHATRASVVKKTWGKHVTNLYFFSDKADASIPTIDIGVPNTKTGHCAKTMAILNRVVEMIEDMTNIQWIFLADDDTILGVQRLCEVLSCYRGGAALTVLGERYGYGYGKRETAAKGYDYITGGGGTVFSVGAARALRTCVCAAHSAPDDMTLGACAKRRNITLTHSPLFHQARPQEYSREVVSRARPLSFHRHAPDPLRLYAAWFLHDDRARAQHRARDEL